MLQAELVLFPVVLVNVAPIAATVPLQIGSGFFARFLESSQSAGRGDYLPDFEFSWGFTMAGIGSA